MLTIFNIVFQHLGEIISIILVLVILSGRKEARANFAWLMAVILFPFVGAFLYILFGNPRLRRMVDEKFSEYKTLEVEQFYSHSEEFDKSGLGEAVERVTGIPPQLCCNLELIPDGGEKYVRLAESIKKARKYIVIEYYVFKNDETGRYFSNLLIRKAEEGVKVYLLIDGLGSFFFTFSKVYRRLKESKANVTVFHPPLGLKTISRVNFRNHRKIAVIDGSICYTGGMNIGKEYSGDSDGSRKWYDAHLSFSGDAVRSMEELFAEDWLFASGEDITDIFTHEEQEGGETALQIIPSGPHLAKHHIYNTIFTTLNRAKDSVVIVTPYLVPDQPVMETLKNISALGIKVKVILPGKNNQPIAAAAGRSYYEELLENGVEIYETKGMMLHAKIVVVDGYFVIMGSANMDGRSFRINFELNIAAYSGDFANETDKLIRFYLENSDKLDYGDVKNRPFAIKIFEGMCRTLGPVL
ncbi:cardiolipin synthase [Limisalsivibrio acetivorans]|uniref:cardiolipin synthase n=1 Tax=Limisalsivibrio acetivorans TaxID=1304888 RepID=UPI0003B53B2B|nr:cardiolipin synthase [Limisalsivibrio acetivorans]